MYRYFAYKDAYRYVDVLPQVAKAYNNTMHNSTGMAPDAVTNTYVLEIWTRINDKRALYRVGRVTFSVVLHVWIGKGKMVFENGFENNYNDELFKIVMVILRTRVPSMSRRI